MKEYNFRVCFGEGRLVNGVYSVRAEDEEAATETALSEICQKLYNAFPELDIEVTIELEEEK